MDREKDRRLGARHVLGPVAVRWRLDDGPVVGPADEGREEGPERAGLLDLSVSGARIMARTSTDISVGDWTHVSIRGRSGPVIVRRILPSRQEGFSQYGIEFLDPMSELTQLVHEELARRQASGTVGPLAAAPPD
ncbi:MAG TPA: PilZ domain-containing protein [Iamia sp.]|nr:PilZ domain-containing protein [Iamia sp.]